MPERGGPGGDGLEDEAELGGTLTDGACGEGGFIGLIADDAATPEPTCRAGETGEEARLEKAHAFAEEVFGVCTESGDADLIEGERLVDDAEGAEGDEGEPEVQSSTPLSVGLKPPAWR